MSIFKRSKKSEIDEYYFDKKSSSSKSDDEIRLDEQIDEGSLDSFWDNVVKDIHKDPEWFTFSDE
ncbi:MAG TPA: hypothetical protein PLO25_03340 [Candidatus Saccharibacteria bacterium]|nr:hypothetical protein [Candidatus Saccharibacteria bacterium]